MPKRGFRVITIREQVYKALDEIRKKLETEKGKPVSYNEVLETIIPEIEKRLEKEEKVEAYAEVAKV
jgi:lipoate-protein ligase A